jgi:hypothetical protein
MFIFSDIGGEETVFFSHQKVGISWSHSIHLKPCWGIFRAHVPLKGKFDCWSQYFCSDQSFAWNGWFLITVDRVHNHSDVGDLSNRFIYQTKNRCITFSEGRCKKCYQQSDLSMMMVLVWILASTGRVFQWNDLSVLLRASSPKTWRADVSFLPLLSARLKKSSKAKFYNYFRFSITVFLESSVQLFSSWTYTP